MTTPFDLQSLSLTAAGQPVDTDAAKEFMTSTLEKIERVELNAVEAELQEKGRRLRALVSPTVLPTLTETQLQAILRTVFATRRRAGAILDGVGTEPMKAAIHRLLYVDAPVDVRFQLFVDEMTGYVGDVRLLRPRKSSDSRAKQNAEQAALEENIFCDFASELLHFTSPNDYWLWTRWIWDPKSGTGSMPLVTMEEVDLHGYSVGETYLKLGVATAFVKATGDAAGFADFGTGPFGIDVFLACVYAVYMYTTLRLRMTQEFNKVVPQLPQLIRRLLGVWKLEI
ncbi:MAG: hypothetical protein H6668_06215 [Ardenticatenaceae bacterium]|nr:hypothetical protein [Ardenticatenaceae bacterium]